MRERRRVERYHSLIAVKYSSIDKKVVGYSLTKDLSKGGLNLPLDKYLSPRTRLLVEIALPNREGKIITTAKVVWARKNRFHWQPLYSAGLRFEKMDVDSIERLINFASMHRWQKSDFEKDLELNRIPVLR